MKSGHVYVEYEIDVLTMKRYKRHERAIRLIQRLQIHEVGDIMQCKNEEIKGTHLKRSQIVGLTSASGLLFAMITNGGQQATISIDE